MGQLLGFVIATAILFLLSMFIMYVDGIRSKDGKGVIFGHSIWRKLLCAAGLTFAFNIVWYIFFSSTNTEDHDSDVTSAFIVFGVQVALVMIAFYLSHLWPKVRGKAEEAARDFQREAEKATNDIRNDFRGNGSSKEEKGPIITPPAKDPLQKAKDAQKGLDDFLGKKTEN